MCSLYINCFISSQRALLTFVFVGLALSIFAQTNPPSTLAKLPADLDQVVLNLGHNSLIVGLHVSSDGKYLCSIESFGRCKIWDLQQARELRSVSTYLSTDARFLPSGVPHKLKTHDGGAYIFDFDLSTGERTRTNQKADRNYLFPSDNLKSHVFTRSQLETLQFSFPDGTTLSRALKPFFIADRYLFNTERKIISVYGAFQAGRKVMLSFYGTDYQDSTEVHLDPNVKKYEFEDFWGWPNTDSLLGKNKDGEVFTFHPLKKDPTFRPFDAGRKINNLVFSPNQELYALALRDNGAIEIRNVKDKSLVLKRYFTTHRISKLVFTPSGENLLFSDGNVIWKWDLKADTLLQFGDFYEVNSNYNTNASVNILPSGKIVTQIPTFESRSLYKIVDLHQGSIHYKEAVPGFGNLVKTGDRILLGGTKGHYLDLLSEQTFPLPSGIFLRTTIPFSKGNLWVMIKQENELVMWDQNQEKVIFSKRGKSPFYQVAMDKRDSLVAVSEKNQVWVMDAKTGQEKALIPIPENSPYHLILKFSADSRYLFITNTDDTYIIIWDIKTNTLFRKITMDYSDFFLFGATNDNQILFGLRALSLVAFNLQGKELYQLGLNAHDPTAEYFPADKLIIIASRDGRIFQVDPQSGVLLKTLCIGKDHQWVSIDQNNQFKTSAGAAHYVHYRTKTGAVGYFPEQKKASPSAESEPFPPLLKPSKISTTLSSVGKPDAPAIATSHPFALANLALKTQLKDENALKAKPSSNLHVSKFPINSPIINAVYTNDDQYIIVQENSGQITIFEHETLRWLKTIKLENPTQVKAVVSKDGQFLACLDGSQTIHLYNIHTGALLQKRTLEVPPITALAISANGQTLAAGSLEGCIYLLKTFDLSLLQTIRPSSGKILTLSFDEQMACADVYASVFLYDLSFLDKIPQPKMLGNYHNYGMVQQIEFCPNSSLILRTSERILSLQYAKTDKPHKDFAINIVGSPWMHVDPSNPHRFYYQSRSRTGYRWKVYDATTLSHVDSILNVNFLHALSRDGKQALTTSPNLTVYNLEDQKGKTITSVSVPVRNWDLSGDAMYYQMGYQVHRVDLSSAKSERISDNHLQGRFLQEGEKLSFVGDYLDKQWTTGKKTLGDTNYIWKLSGISGLNAVSDNGLYLACLWNNKDTAYVYSTHDLKVVHRLPLPNAEKGNRIGISNNAQYLAIGTEEGDLRVYDLLSKKLLLTSNQLANYPSFSKDNSVVIFFDGKNQIVYDLKSAKLLHTLPQTPELKKVQGMSSNGRFAILSSADSPSQLWDLQKSILLGDLYFMIGEQSLPAWAFVGVDGRFDGNPDGLKKMYRIDEKTLKSRDSSLDASGGYTPGLLSQLIK